jgi:hypothetical protein
LPWSSGKFHFQAMPKPVVDEFSELLVSRQRKEQLRHKRDGKCILCPRPLATKNHCRKHALAARERSRKRNGSKRKNRTALDRRGPEIQDEFTHLDLPYFKKMRLRYRRDGLGIICGDPAVTKLHCLKDAGKNREKVRQQSGAKRRNRNAASYRAAARRSGKKTGASPRAN